MAGQQWPGVATTEQGATLKTQKHENRGYQIGGTQCRGNWYGLSASGNRMHRVGKAKAVRGRADCSFQPESRLTSLEVPAKDDAPTPIYT